MTDQEKRIKLAKFRGWTEICMTGGFVVPRQLMGCIPGDSQRLPIPDYFNDLNDTHDLENTLSDYPSRDRELYAETLWEVIKKDINRAFGNRVVSLMHASAAQRANALGIHFKLWEA